MSSSDEAIGGRLPDNIVYFARTLRAAGLPVGPGRVVDAVTAVRVGGFEFREDFYHTLAACFLSRPEQRAVFDQCFHMFWRDPQLLEKAIGLLLPELTPIDRDRKRQAAETRAVEAMTKAAHHRPPPSAQERTEIELNARLTSSAQEVIRTRDFEQMTASEQGEAKRAIARLSLPVRPIASRRTRPDDRGSLVDWRTTMRTAMRRGGEMSNLSRRERRKRWPALVCLCDISGSMASYSRMLLHFLHAAANAKGAGWSKVHAFTFGTVLTNITRHLTHRDIDEALARVGAEATDWEGGTRIGEAIESFNRDWSRRVLGQGAVVLLITDGLDRGDPERLEAQAERLSLSCRRLIWLNPLLRWDGFEVKAQGIKALLPYVDSFRSAHNIESLERLAISLSRADDQGEKVRLMRALG